MNPNLPIHLIVNVNQHQEQLDPQNQELIRAVKENNRILRNIERMMKQNLHNQPFTVKKAS